MPKRKKKALIKKGDQKLNCVIHYNGLDSYSKIKEISEANEQRIRQAKALRELRGGSNHHENQCKSIPDTLITGLHGIHMTPCYKKFTLILASNESDKLLTPTRSSERSSISVKSRVAWLFPEECNICNKTRLKLNKDKFEFPTTITTTTAEKTIKESAKQNDPNLYSTIADIDLIAKEFKYHRTCYRNFTRDYHSTAISSPKSSGQDTIEENRGDFDKVKQFITENILDGNQAISMSILQEIYGIGATDNRYRYKLKKKIEAEFTDQLYFVTAKANSPEIVINANKVSFYIKPTNENNIITAANILKKEILQYCDEKTKLPWPPTIEQLSSSESKIPESVQLFLTELLKSEKHSVLRSDNITRLIESYAADLIHGVTRGEVMTSKHFLLALGIHNITGSKTVVEILNKLGHCISYPDVCDIETGYAKVAQQNSTHGFSLPIQPKENQVALTVFWVDNFDIAVENPTGGSSVHTTHLVAFQEETENTSSDYFHVSVSKTKSRKVNVDEVPVSIKFVDAKKEPPQFNNQQLQSPFMYDTKKFNTNYLIWLILRKNNAFDQLIPTFSGWKLQSRKKENESSIVKTTECYLPPITSKVTDYETIHKYMEYLQVLSSEVGMPYVNITLDVGAAINAYKYLWNNYDIFDNVVIHLGDFHFMKENFKVIGKIIAGSGFEDIVFQSDLCSSGSLNGVLCGSHYNRAWIIHNNVSEALERMLFARFIGEQNSQLPDSLVNLCADPESYTSNTETQYREFLSQYDTFRQSVKEGKIGKTPQFWLIYLDLMKNQNMIHLAVQENDFDCRLYAWQEMLPLYFATNQVNYARYGSYYVETLRNLDQSHPGLENLLLKKGLTAQAQEKYPCRTAIDQRGEQSINRDAKTTGGIKGFASDNSAVTKWCLNRPEQAKNTNALKILAGVKSSSDIYKALRPSQIIKSEENVTRLVQTFENDYINPFSIALETNKLYNLSSGVAVEDSLADKILSVTDVGKSLAELFRKERLIQHNIAFHEPIKRNPIVTFKDTLKSAVIRKDNKSITLQVNRNIIGALLSFTARSGRAIDFEKALKFPLSPVPLSIANGDGTRRETSKSKLMDVLNPSSKESVTAKLTENVSDYIIDFIALVRTLTVIPKTFENLFWKLIKILTVGCSTLHIVADSYRDVSIKTSERNKRGMASKVYIKSVYSNVPRDFQEFLKNGDNKNRLVELFFDYVIQKRCKVLNITRANTILLSKENLCMSVTLSSSTEVTSLSSNQEEADTKVILHCANALSSNNDSIVILCSPSGDTDINILAAALLQDYKSRLFIEYGTGSNKKGCWLQDFLLNEADGKVLLGLHAFTGNDFVSSFFRKGKLKCWKTLQKFRKFEDSFSQLGSNWSLPDYLFNKLEEYVCNLYGFREKDIDKVRWLLFQKKHTKENKVIDLSALPPCRSVLRLHSERANFVAKIWRTSLENRIDKESFANHGWNEDGTIQWIEEAYPDDIGEIFFDNLYDDEQYDFGSDNEDSDNDDED